MSADAVLSADELHAKIPAAPWSKRGVVRPTALGAACWMMDLDCAFGLVVRKSAVVGGTTGVQRAVHCGDGGQTSVVGQ